jgi:hypothetical protein
MDCDKEFPNAQAVMDFATSQLRGAPRFEVYEQSYTLDQNYAEWLNTSSMVFISSRRKNDGVGCVPIGRELLHGPIMVSGSGYRGFGERQLALAAGMIQFIVDTSIPDASVDNAKSFDELMRECKAK